jgi:hypothetical protein
MPARSLAGAAHVGIRSGLTLRRRRTGATGSRSSRPSGRPDGEPARWRGAGGEINRSPTVTRSDTEQRCVCFRQDGVTSPGRLARNRERRFISDVSASTTGHSRWREGEGAATSRRAAAPLGGRANGIAAVITLESPPESPVRRDKAQYRAWWD